MSAILSYKTIGELMKRNGNLQDITVEDMEFMYREGFITVLNDGKVADVK